MGGGIYFVNGRWSIVCRHNDMRCGNEGLTNVLTDKYDLDLFNQTIFLFCGRKKIETKLYTGIVTDLCCYI